MMRAMLCVVLLLGLAGAAQAQAGLPIGSVDAVWVQAVDGSGGSLAGVIGLKWPSIGATKLDALPVLNTIKPQILVQHGDLGTSILPGFAVMVETDTAVKFKVGLCYLPTSTYKTGFFVGAQLLTVTF